jgi:hypothetical protein
MIKIPLYLQSAIDGHVEELAEVVIWNDATGTKSKGNYQYRVYGKGGVVRKGRITGFKRLTNTAPRLLALVMKDAYPE